MLRMVTTVNQAVNNAVAAWSKLHSVFTSRLLMKTKLKVYGAVYVRSRLTYAAPAWYAFCLANQAVSRLQVQQNWCFRLIVGAPRYIRNDVIHRDNKTPTVEDYMRRLARAMFARADRSACAEWCVHTSTISHRSTQDRLMLLLSPPVPNTVVVGDDSDDRDDG